MKYTLAFGAFIYGGHIKFINLEIVLACFSMF